MQVYQNIFTGVDDSSSESDDSGDDIVSASSNNKNENSKGENSITNVSTELTAAGALGSLISMYSVSDGESEDDIGPTETTAKGLFIYLLLLMFTIIPIVLLTPNIYYYTDCTSYF